MNIPSVLFRAFQESVYRDSFMSGKIRFKHLSGYRNIEDRARQDMTEGRPWFRQAGEALLVNTVNETIVSVPGVESVTGDAWDRYIVSFSMNTDLNFISEHFGKYLVCVTNPEKFIREINNEVQEKHESWDFDHSRIFYNRGDYLELNNEEERRLLWTQKPINYESEMEYRIQIKTDISYKEETICINLEDKLDYFELLDL